MTVNIEDINDPPVLNLTTELNVYENGLNNQTGIILSGICATDEDGDDITLSLSGDSKGYFQIGTSCDANLRTRNHLNYEEKSRHELQVNASDGEDTDSHIIVINVLDLNDTPVITSDLTFNVAEGETYIGQLSATDEDGDNLVWGHSEGANVPFTINATTGELNFVSAPDYEAQNTYEFDIWVQDDDESNPKRDAKTVVVNITNVNEAPTFTSAASFSADENQTAVGTVTASDPDGQSLSYSLTGADSASFSIGSSTGILAFNSAPNFEVKESYQTSVRATDGLVTVSQNITVTINDVNDAPVATAASYYLNLMPEGQTSGLITLAGTDEDGDTLTYSLTSNASYGNVSLNGTSVSYETASTTNSAQSDSFTFKVNDGVLDSATANIAIDIRSDPLYKHQWHLNNTGQTNFASLGGTAGEDLNVDSVIANGITGDGVTVAVVDEGLELTHEDLADNVAAGSYDFVNQDTDPARAANDGDHGTSVAGLIAAKGWNNKGGRGVAPNASLIGYNFIESGSTAGHAQVWGASPPIAVDVDVYNNSWGSGYSGNTYQPFSSLSETGTILSTLKFGTESLREGKGVLYIYSAGNGYASYSNDLCGASLACTELIYDGRKNQPYTIPVAALAADGQKTSYSTPGPGVWVSGFVENMAGIMIT